MKKMTIKQVCMYCRKQYGTKEGMVGDHCGKHLEPVSHGICDGCMRKQHPDDVEDMEDPDYLRMTSEDHGRILCDIVDEEVPCSLILSIPGVYDVLTEHFHNEVLKRWTEEQNT